MNGYKQKEYGLPTKRYVQTMDLKDNPELLSKYRQLHSREGAWKEVISGIREVGILEMELYLCGSRAVMIVDAAKDFDWDSAMKRLATLPRQQEWEEHVAQCQQCDTNATSDEKWQMMDRIFYLYE